MKNLNNVIFFIRHNNDLDFLLPIIVNACEPIIIYYKIFKVEEIHRLIIKDYSITEYNFEYNLIDRVLFFFIKIFNFFSSIFFKKKFYKIIQKIEFKVNISKLKKILKQIRIEKVNYVVFDHTSEYEIEGYIKYIKKLNSKNLKFYALPHGVGDIYQNLLHDYSNIKPNYIKIGNFFDKIICNDEYQKIRINKSNSIVIDNLRYTSYWIDFLKKYISIKNENKKNNTIKIILFHSKKIGSVNIDEIIRTILIVKQFKNLTIKIMPHPRSSNEIQYIKKRTSIKTFDGHPVEALIWADYSIHIQSSTILDSLLLKKPILYPSYISSNIIDQKYSKYFINLYSPDDFFNFIKDINNSKKTIIPTTNFESASWKSNLNLWKKVFKS